MDESSIKPEKRSRVRGRDHLILYELMPSGRAVSAGKAAHPVTTFVLLLFQEIYPIQARAFFFSFFYYYTTAQYRSSPTGFFK